MKCHFCQEDMPRGASFCPSCGRHQLTGAKVTETSVPGTRSKGPSYWLPIVLLAGLVVAVIIAIGGRRENSPRDSRTNQSRSILPSPGPDAAVGQIVRSHCPSGSLATAKGTPFASQEFDQILDIARRADRDSNDIEPALGKMLAGKLRSIPSATLVRIITGKAVGESYGYWAACQVELVESIHLPNAAIGSRVWIPVGSLNVIPRTTPLYVTGTPVILQKYASMYRDLASLRMHKTGDESPQAIRAFGSIEFRKIPTRFVIAEREVVGEWIGYRLLEPPVTTECMLHSEGCRTWWVSGTDVGPAPDSQVY
jgi:hypothetical protein